MNSRLHSEGQDASSQSEFPATALNTICNRTSPARMQQAVNFFGENIVPAVKSTFELFEQILAITLTSAVISKMVLDSREILLDIFNTFILILIYLRIGAFVWDFTKSGPAHKLVATCSCMRRIFFSLLILSLAATIMYLGSVICLKIADLEFINKLQNK